MLGLDFYLNLGLLRLLGLHSCHALAGLGIAAGAVLAEGIKECLAHGRLALLAVQVLTVALVGHKAHLREHRGHCRAPQHKIGALACATVGNLGGLGVVLLHHLRKDHTLLGVGILHQREDDETLGTIGVVALILGLIVALEHNHRVLPLGHGEVLFALVVTHNVGAATVGLGVAHCIGVDRDEEVGTGTVGNVAPLVEFDETVVLAGVDDLHIGVGLLNHLAQGEDNVEVEVFLQLIAPRAPGVLASVARIEHHSVQTSLRRLFFHLGRYHEWQTNR